MIKTKKLLTVLLTGVLALLTLFAGTFIPTKAEEPTTIKKVSVLNTGGISFLFYYDGDPTKVDNINTIDFIPEEGITSHDQAVKVKSQWSGDMGLWAIHLYIMVDLTATPYENYNSVTIELSALDLEAWVDNVNEEPEVDPETEEETYPKAYVVGENYTEEDSSLARRFKIQKGNNYLPVNAAFLSDGEFTTTIEKEDGEKRFTLYNDSNIFKNVMSENSDFEGETEIPPLEADVNVTFDFACYVEIDEDKIGTTDNEGDLPSDTENEENNEGEDLGKIEEALNKAGIKISELIEKNIGISIGGTSSVVVLVVIVIILIRRKRR